MPTDEEIERRVTTDDTPITTRRIAIAQKVTGLATQIAVVAEQLQDLIGQVRQEIGDNNDIITVEKLAIYTDIPKANLNEWLAGYKTVGKKRKRPLTVESNAEPIPSHNETHRLLTSDDQASVDTPMAAKNGTTARIPEHRERPAIDDLNRDDQRRPGARPNK